MVKTIAQAIGVRRPIVPVPPALGFALGWLLGRIKGDVIITRQEIRGLMDDLLCVDSPPAGSTKLSDWAQQHADELGKHYANDVPDELFDRIANTGETEAVQNPVQQPAEPARKLSQTANNESEQDDDNPVDCEALRSSATRCEQLGKWSRGESNPRAGTVSKPRLHV